MNASSIPFKLAFAVFFLIDALTLSFSGCTSTTAPENQTVIGKWAGTVDYSGRHFLAVLDIHHGGTFTDSLQMDGVTQHRDAGTWTVSGDQFISKNRQCESLSGTDLVLVLCATVPDSARINISGNVWTQSGIIGGNILTIDFRRL